MPIYEYRCSACGFQNDYLQKMSEPPLTDCPECGKSTFTKQVTAAGFQLKGTGWYATDFKNNGASAGAASKKSGSGATATAGSAAEAGTTGESGSAGESGSTGTAAPACGAGACSAS